MKAILVIIVVAAAVLTGCGIVGSHHNAAAAPPSAQPKFLTEDEKHRLYTAALVASDAPLENEAFKDVCRRIGIFNAGGAPNENYLPFVAAHVDWAMKTETDQFKQEIKTKGKALEYLSRHLPSCTSD